MKSIHRLGRVLCGAVVLLALVSSPALADEEGDRPQPAADLVVEEAFQVESSEALQDQVNAANNPLADLIAVSLHNYYFPKLNGIPDESANTFWLRLVTPFWRIVPRVSLPIQVVPAPNPTASVAKVTGIGDLNVFATFILTPDDSPAMFGLGPIYTAPTASNDALGHGKHEVGAAALTIWTKGIVLLGALVNYQIGVGGDSSKPQTQFIVAQPIVSGVPSRQTIRTGSSNRSAGSINRWATSFGMTSATPTTSRSGRPVGCPRRASRNSCRQNDSRGLSTRLTMSSVNP